MTGTASEYDLMAFETYRIVPNDVELEAEVSGSGAAYLASNLFTAAVILLVTLMGA